MSTLYTIPGITGPHDLAHDARRTYGADGRDYGMLSPRERVSIPGYDREECDPATDTVTVWTTAD